MKSTRNDIMPKNTKHASYCLSIFEKIDHKEKKCNVEFIINVQLKCKTMIAE